MARLGVRVYARRDAGIYMQRGFRGSDKGRIFKFQVWFVDIYDKDKDKSRDLLTSDSPNEFIVFLVRSDPEP